MFQRNKKSRQDSRLATLIITLPVCYPGGPVVATDHEGKKENFLGNGRKPTKIKWMAFRFEGGYAVEPVQSGCMITISYGVYIASHGHTNPDLTVDTLMTPSDRFFDLLSPINSRGQSIASLLNHDYNIDPAEALKGGDALLYDAFKLHKFAPQLHWTAGGFMWTLDYTLESFGDDINTNTNPNKSLLASPGRTVPPVAGANTDGLRIKVQKSGGVTLAEANITLLTNARNPAPGASCEHFYFISNSELEKLIVNALLVIYIP
ncbi:hypothetical protein CVT25_002332 [Psilocybe cyanescens]|uniref:Uncharacterized protein n=1 Tax=Psilocybe cyanescens TaxID=93625 RepID=A0A409WKF2_PSICY|nr:hypothetical protein CVT25_002332 [Psilocybe cyanescens]